MTTDLEFHNLSGMPKLDHPEGKYSIYCVDFSIDRNELMPEEIFARAVAGYNVQSNIIGKPIAYLVENSMRKSIESIVNGASVTLERGETMITVSYEYCTKLKPTQ
jgi:hypothetical protein